MCKERERKKESSKERKKERETSNTNSYSNSKTYNRKDYTSATLVLTIANICLLVFSISFSRRLAPDFSNSISTSNMEVQNDGIKTSKQNDRRESLGQRRPAFSAGSPSGKSSENRNPASEPVGPDVLSKSSELAAGEMLPGDIQSRRDAVESCRLRAGGHEPGSEKPAGSVHEHPEKRAQLSELKGVDMARSDLEVFGVTICGRHPDFITKRYYGVASKIDDAMIMANAAALADGWTEIDYDDISKIGPLSFAPWPNEQESEVEQCQQ